MMADEEYGPRSSGEVRDESAIDAPHDGGELTNVIPFPHMRADQQVAEHWIRERDLSNKRLETKYRLRGPLDALDDLIRKRSLPQFPMPRAWPELSKRAVTYVGEVLAISGPSGGGKTSFAIQMALAAAGEGVPILWLPLELDDVELNLRIVANLVAAHTLRIRETWSRDQIARTLVSVADIWRFVDRMRDPAHQIQAMREAVAIAKRIYRRPPMLVVDYIGKMGRGARDPRLVLADAIESIREFTVELECYTVILSQTSRGNNAVLTGKVDLDSAADAIGVSAETGELEHAASVALALNVFKADDAQALKAHVLATKCRGSGLEGRQGFEFSKPGGVWRELDYLPATPVEVTAEVAKQKKDKSRIGTPTAQTARSELDEVRGNNASGERKRRVVIALQRTGALGMDDGAIAGIVGAGRGKLLTEGLAELHRAGEIERTHTGRWRMVNREPER